MDLKPSYRSLQHARRTTGLAYSTKPQYNRPTHTSKTQLPMLEAHKKHKVLKSLEARIPEDAAGVKDTLHTMLKDEPVDTKVLLLLARCQLSLDETGDARQTLETLLKYQPDNGIAKVELAKIFFNENQSPNAIRLLTEVTNAMPEILDNWQLLGKYAQQDKQVEASKYAFNQYELIKAFNDNLESAEQAFINADFSRSDRLCRMLLQQVHNEPRALRLLARIAKQFRHYEINTALLANCVEMQPGNADVGLDYAYSLLSSKKFQEAIVQCHRLQEIAPEKIDIYDVKAGALVALGQYEEAISIYRELVKEHEKRALCLLRLGNVLKTVGETAQAIGCYQQAIELEPMSGEAYWSLADLKTHQFSADEITSMQQLTKAGDISAIDKVLIQFALGQALEDSQQFSESFEYYQSANSDYRSIRPPRYSSQNAAMKSFFGSGYFSGRKESGHDSGAPIFIVGLPRSGSTLLEQILSSHSQVDATMELTEVISIARELNDPNQQGRGQYPRVMAGMTVDQVQNLAQRYLDYAQPMRQQAPYFIDKEPANFHHIGLIKTLFPKAKIIDVRRDPMASGWSLYKHFFAEGNQFSYDLATIGKYYNDYVELMDHWHGVLPEQILTVTYEDLINDLPGTLEDILKYCGLTFEEACLSHHLNTRSVATASSEQVRQPLYSKALEHWKNYEEFLSPLKHVIEKNENNSEN